MKAAMRLDDQGFTRVLALCTREVSEVRWEGGGIGFMVGHREDSGGGKVCYFYEFVEQSSLQAEAASAS